MSDHIGLGLIAGNLILAAALILLNEPAFALLLVTAAAFVALKWTWNEHQGRPLLGGPTSGATRLKSYSRHSRSG